MKLPTIASVAATAACCAVDYLAMRAVCLAALLAATSCAQFLDLDAYDDVPPSATAAAASTGGSGGATSVSSTGGGAAAGGTGGSEPPQGCGIGLCVFVSNAMVRPGANYDFDSVGEANALCSEWASQAGVPGVAWRAWLAGVNQTALQNLATTDGPWFDLDGNLVALNRQVLTSGSLSHGIGIDEHGLDQVGLVWTGALANGNTNVTCSDWDMRDGSEGLVGQANAMDGAWTEWMPSPCNIPARLYCFGIE